MSAASMNGRILLLCALLLMMVMVSIAEEDHHDEEEHEDPPHVTFYKDFDADKDGNLELSEVYKSIDTLKIDGTCVMEEFSHRGFASGISSKSENLHNLLLLLAAQLSTQTCNFGEKHTEGREEDLLNRLMLNFGDGVSMSGKDLLKMWNLMVTNQNAVAAASTGGGAHTGHNHAHSRHVLAVEENDHAHKHTCAYMNNTIVADKLYREGEVRTLVEHFVLDIVEGCHNTKKECKSPSSDEVWGYSTLAVLIVTLVAGVSIIIAVPVMRSHHLMFEWTLAFAAGTLLGDAFLHILPAILGDHSHNTPELNDYEKRNHMLVSLATILLFYAIDWFCRGALDGKTVDDCASMNDNESTHPDNTDDEMAEKKPTTEDVETDKEDKEGGEEKKSAWAWTPMSQVSRLVWVVVVADGIHNITDGLSIGAAFSTSNSLGLSTALASGFHEIPQEIADFAILLGAGLSPFQAVVLNLLSGCSSILANFVACAAGTSSNSSITWFLAVTVGSFVYLALGIVIPEILHSVNKIRFKQLAVHCLGMIMGATVMWIIAITESHDEC